MTLGLAERQGNLLDDVERFCDETLDETLDLRLLAPGAGAALPRRGVR